MKPEERSRDIELILSDVDGVLTDGGIIYDNQGIETKRFHVRDGLGIKLWRRAGYRFGLLTPRTSHIVKLRATELGADVLRQGFEDKLPVANQVFQELGVQPNQVCYIGDDFPDLPVMQTVGLSVAVAGAPEEIAAHAHYVTRLDGGSGAVRETIELILKAKGQWDDLVRKYAAS